MDGLIGLLLGLFIGGTAGVFFTALIAAAREGDNLWEYLDGGGADGKDDKR